MSVIAPDVPWKQTASRKAFPLINPKVADIDFNVDIAGSLSRLARFTGDIRGGAYSVAQHCVMGADLIYDRLASPLRAAAFLLHDAHEAYIGDIATPAQDAINWHLQAILEDAGLTEMICRNISGIAGPLLFKTAVRRLKSDLDETIYTAAGLEWPLRTEVAITVHEMDVLMLAAEVDAFMGGEVADWSVTRAVRAAGAIPDLRLKGIWPASVAEARFKAAFRFYLPNRFPQPANPET